MIENPSSDISRNSAKPEGVSSISEEEITMKTTIFMTLALVFVLLVNCGQAGAQATAQISGRVQDATAAVLPGVEITATNTATGIARMTVTNESGAYVLPNLPI